MSAAADRLQACVSGQLYVIPKRSDVQELLDERRQLIALATERDLFALDLAEARASAQASAELAGDYARQLAARPTWSEFWAMILLLPITFTIAAARTSLGTGPA